MKNMSIINNSLMNQSNFHLVFKMIFLLVLAANFSVLAEADPGRGTWLWAKGSHPYGSNKIVGDSAKEDEVIEIFNTYGITEVYGSYRNLGNNG